MELTMAAQPSPMIGPKNIIANDTRMPISMKNREGIVLAIRKMVAMVARPIEIDTLAPTPYINKRYWLVKTAYRVRLSPVIFTVVYIPNSGKLLMLCLTRFIIGSITIFFTIAGINRIIIITLMAVRVEIASI